MLQGRGEAGESPGEGRPAPAERGEETAAPAGPGYRAGGAEGAGAEGQGEGPSEEADGAAGAQAEEG